MAAASRRRRGEPRTDEGQRACDGASARSSGATADEAFSARARALEEQVTDLKEQVARSRARLMMLQETVLGGDLNAGARAAIFHRNEMGSAFVLEQVTYALDGAPVFVRKDDGDLSKREEFEVFNGRVLPGQHQLVVKLTYRGQGYGVFSYLEGYKFNVQSTHVFNAEAGKVTTLKVVGFEKADVTTDLKDRPQIRYDVELAKDPSLQSLPAAEPQVAAPASP